MAVSSTPYDTDRFGAALPRFSPRQSDLLMVVGTLTHKQAPVLLKVYEQMCEPKWVMAFGACATSGGFYQNYAARRGHRQDHSRGHLRSRLPAAARDRHRRDHEAAGPDRALAPSDPHRHVLTMAAPIARPSGCSVCWVLQPRARTCRTACSCSMLDAGDLLDAVRRLKARASDSTCSSTSRRSTGRERDAALRRRLSLLFHGASRARRG